MPLAVPRVKMYPVRPLAERVAALGKLLTMFEPVPADWCVAGKHSAPSVECTECSDYKTLVNSWRKALKWTSGLDHALSVMLACVSSTRLIGDQLWIKVIGPAACGKSTLCEALSTNDKYVLAKSTFRGFHTGYKDANSQGKDISLTNRLRNMTFITKDGDTLLQSPNLEQILSEGRDLYDCVSRTDYRNAVANDYHGVRMTWILAGTSSLRRIDSSELGERFLDVVIMHGIDVEVERSIMWRVVNRADRNVAMEANGKPETQHDPDLLVAMGLTGGYVGWLRENACRVIGGITLSDDAKWRIVDLGLLVAYMRARPSKLQEENAEREFGSRLVSQLTRLAKCLAFVLNKTEVDDEVMGRVQQVALDTARGRTLSIVSVIYHDEGETTVKSLCAMTHMNNSECRGLLRFLSQIGAVQKYRSEEGGERWRLTKEMNRLYKLTLLGDA